MAAKRGRSQARRNSGGGGGSLPGWAWMVLGIVLTVGVILAAPKFLNGEGKDGFFRPKANPDAQPVAATDEDAEIEAPGRADAAAPARPVGEEANEPDYDFYELLPGEEVALTDAQLAAAARAEADRERRNQARARQDAAAQDAAQATAQDTGRPQPLPESSAADAAAVERASAPVASAPSRAVANDTPYILQAGAFGASGDAEAVKARIALLGLNARVESAQINGKTVYRVRLGPYGSASELATAKGKLANGGLPAVAIRAK